MLLNLIGGILSNGLGIFGDYLEGKRKVKQARVTAEVEVMKAKVLHVQQLAAAEQKANIEWDTIMARGSESSWKDEFYVILLSIPAVMAFIPGLAVYVGKGFDELAKAPEWYLAAFGIAVAASFGYRKFADAMVKRAQ